MARELAAFVVPPGPVPLGGGLVELARVDALLDGSIAFDVAVVREHARGLVALADEQERFEAWTRERGLGPENREPGAFGGWDIDDCPDCNGAGMLVGWENDVQDCDCYQGKVREPARGGWPGNLAREWAALGHDRRAPMGRSLARLGQRILDMLDGDCWWAPSAERQPSECQHPACLSGRTMLVNIGGGQIRRCAPPSPDIVPSGHSRGLPGERSVEDCPDCQGTGHNLRGILPPLEWSPAVRRAVVDHVQALHDGASENLPSWKIELGRRAASPGQRVLSGALKLTIAGWNERTRVTPRGRHVLQPDTGPTGVKLRDQLRGANVWHANAAPESPMQVHPPQAARHDAHVRDWKRSKFPRWRRGELRRALQRWETST